MTEQYFGTQELYQVVLKPNSPMVFGNRTIEVGEPILYFDNVKISSLSSSSRAIAARGGWSNLSRVVWEDKGDVNFTLDEGVVNSIGMSLAFGMLLKEQDGRKEEILIPHREGPFKLDSNGKYRMKHNPCCDRKLFCFRYENNAIQEKVDYKLETVVKDVMGIKKKYSYISIDGDKNDTYIADYYFIYGDTSLLYTLGKERLKGTFSLEGKFYTKDENEGKNVTNILTLPKVKILSDINLRLGERANPMTSIFNMVAMPVRTTESDSLVMKVLRLEEDLEEE